MKKIVALLSICCVFGLITGKADAKCKLLSCNDTDLFSIPIQASVGGNQCWFCGPGPNSCGANDVVPVLDGYGEIIALYQCAGWAEISKGFMNYEPGTFCEGSQLKSRSGVSGIDLANAVKIYSFEGVATTKYDLGDLPGYIGRASCIYVKCNPGYMPNDDETACVLDTRESDCTSTGGTWTGSECTCDQGKNITQSTNGKSCVCISSDYEPDGVNGCKKTAAAIAADQQRQQDADNRSRKEACVNSGGAWTGSECTCDASKNLRVQNNVCVCLDDENYKRSGDRCVLTDAAALRQKCESATGAYWDGVSCQCYEPNYSFNGTVCREDPAITECKSISGARWANGKCVCNQSGYVPNYQTKQCEKSAATLQAEQAVAAQQKIDQASATLQSITDGLRVNKWRNEEGKFNTSRLLSDSIAGVVLGTAGGLITSSVVKKSQVSDGFEDMQCTVGGQVVAGWGDEFRVGIQ